LQEYLIRLDLWNWGTARYDFSWSTSPGGVVREKTTGSAVTASRDIPGEGIVEGKEQHGQATMVFGEAGPQTVTLRAYVMQTPAIYVERTINVTVVMPPPTVNSVSCQEATLGQKVHCSINAQAVDGTLRYLWVAQEGTVENDTSPDADIVFRTPGTKTLTAIAYLEEDPAMAVNTSVTVNVTDNPMEVQISCPESVVTTGDTFNCTAQASAAWGTPVFTWSMDGGTVNSVGPAGYFTPKKAGTLPVRVTMSLAGADWLTKTATTSVKVIGENDITAQIVGPKGVYVRMENTYEAQAPCITEGRCTVRWRVDGVEQEGPFLTVTFPVEGRYVLQVEIMYTGSTLSKVSELAVQVGELPKPIVNIKGPGAVFVGEPTLYKVEVAEKHRNLNVTGRWILFDGSYAEGETVTVIATAGGYQMLAYEAWIEGEKEATVRITKKRINCVAYVFPVPKISVKSVEGAAPYRVTFKTQDTVKRVPGADYAITYKWDFGDGETQTTTNTIVGHTFTKIGAYQVRMTAMDQHGNTSTDTKTITAGTPPVEIALKVSASNKAVRAPVEIYVKSAITKRSTLDRLESHTWAIDGVVVQDTQPGWVKTTFREPGTHTVTYAATMKSGAVGTGDTTIVVSPNQPPACDIEYKDNPTSRYVYLKAKCSDPDGRMSGYKWDLDDGRGFRNGNMNISFKATETRTYNVTVKGIDDAGEACTFTKAIPITR
jgi:PKD repeat protein